MVIELWDDWDGRVPKGHRAVGWLGWKGPYSPLSSSCFNYPAVGRAVTHQLRLPRAASNWISNTFRNGPSTAFLGSLCKGLTTLSKEFLPHI